MPRDLLSAVEFSHELVRRHVEKGQVWIDATAGNGHDTVLLARLVGGSGHVFAFDIQRRAIRNTAAKLKEQSLSERVDLFQKGHEHLRAFVDRTINGAIFNLGYLPGADKSITTEPRTTIKALRSCLDLLAEEGLVVLVAYLEHPGGQQELQALMSFLRHLDHHVYNVGNYRFINQKKAPPQVLAVKKRATVRGRSI